MERTSEDRKNDAYGRFEVSADFSRVDDGISVPQLRSLPARLIKLVHTLLTSQEYFVYVASALLLFESVLCFAIIRFVPYTEIDFTTYMQQVKLFLNGERQYTLIKGDTGPVVYPAGFIYVYSGLYFITNGGGNIRLAQHVFAQLYLFTMAMVFELLRRSHSVPPYALVLLCLSKRLHSIYVLRLFNEGPAMLFFYAALLAWTNRSRKSWTTGSILFSLALSIKMNFLLVLPGLLFLFWTSLGVTQAVIQLVAIVSTQFVLAAPFLTSRSNAIEYFTSAFNFGREFEWQWTVNWRWLGHTAFESRETSQLLLVLHALTLVIVGFAWCKKDGGVWGLITRGLKKPNDAPLSESPTADHICAILFLSNTVGMIFARSLHYQFYAWYAHQIVFLLWHTPFTVYQKSAIFLIIEYGWHKFPSTSSSSLGLTLANLALVVGMYYGDLTGIGGRRGNIRARIDASEKSYSSDDEGLFDRATGKGSEVSQS